MKKHSSGFTLIELLVVIAIIAFLTTVVLGATMTARIKARDATRMDDLHQVAVSLESYYNEHGNSYPSTGGSANYQGTCSGYARTGANGWVPNLAPKYIPILPQDPIQNGPTGCYLYTSDGTDYKLLAHQTVEYGCPVPSSSAYYDPKRPTECTFQVSTSGAANW